MVRDGTTVGSIHKPHKDNTKPIIGDGITYFFATFLFVYSPNLIALINNPLLTKKLRGSHNHENIEEKFDELLKRESEYLFRS